jgi:hypothetical protein
VGRELIVVVVVVVVVVGVVVVVVDVDVVVVVVVTQKDYPASGYKNDRKRRRATAQRDNLARSPRSDAWQASREIASATGRESDDEPRKRTTQREA